MFKARTPEVGIISDRGVLSPPVETREEDCSLRCRNEVFASVLFPAQHQTRPSS